MTRKHMHNIPWAIDDIIDFPFFEVIKMYLSNTIAARLIQTCLYLNLENCTKRIHIC